MFNEFYPPNEAIRYFRNQLDFSMRQLALRSGESVRTIGNAERGQEVKKAGFYCNVARALLIEESLLYWLHRSISLEKDNLLSTHNPGLFAELHKTKNHHLDINKLSIGSGQKVWWTCSECNHDWKAQVNNRSNKSNPSGCPSCSTKPLSVRKLAKDTHPEIMAQYHPYKNNKPIEKVHPSDRAERWWICNICTHEFKASVFNRVTLIKYRHCRNCQTIEEKGHVLNAISVFGGKIIKVNDNTSPSEFYVECNKGHRFTIDSDRAKKMSWCKDCGLGASFSSKVKIDSKNKFANELAHFGYKLNDTLKLGATTYHEVTCPEGHITRKTPQSVSADKRAGKTVLKCSECQKSGKYLKVRYGSSEDVVDAINRLGIQSNKEYIARYKEDPMLPPHLTKSFPCLKGFWGN